jgi:hypothetical protein
VNRPSRDVRVPEPSGLLDALDCTRMPVGLYDVADPSPFAPLVAPRAGARRGPCIFDFFRHWQNGETLHLTRESYGCGGAGRALFGVQTRDREAFIDFLCGDEGLRASRELMAGWIDGSTVYRPQHEHILIGPLRPEQHEALRTVTFWVNPDQLAVLLHGCYYDHAWGDPPPVAVPFGSGCMELVATFDDLDRPQAALTGTDLAMRDQLPPDVVGLTVTTTMFARLCALDERSFLGKAFLADLRAARGGSLGT